MRKGIPRVKAPAPEGTLASRVQRVRQEMNLTQLAVQELTGVDRGVVAHLELNQRSTIDFQTAIKLARGLDVSLDYLAGFQDNFGTCPGAED